MKDFKDYNSSDEIAWCPGCGNFGILTAVKRALAELEKNPKDVLLVSGIGQAAKLPHYVKSNCFNGLHGRALPVAAAAKIANRDLTVLVHTGDGDCYGEGGNHLIHNIRRNINITVIVHNNQIYGLTKGQASPTTDYGYPTKVQVKGVILEPLNALELVLAAGAGFIARGYSKEMSHLTSLIVEGIKYEGFSLIEVLQPCVSFNKKNTFQWYSERIYKVEDEKGYNPTNRSMAYNKTQKWGSHIPIGVIYKKAKKTYEEKAGLNDKKPLVKEDIKQISIRHAMNEFR